MELLLPLLLVDLILGRMVWTSWRRREVMGLSAAREREVYWFSFARLVSVLLLALIGTVAACAAMD
jgi:hypothetical protein